MSSGWFGGGSSKPAAAAVAPAGGGGAVTGMMVQEGQGTQWATAGGAAGGGAAGGGAVYSGGAYVSSGAGGGGGNWAGSGAGGGGAAGGGRGGGVAGGGGGARASGGGGGGGWFGGGDDYPYVRPVPNVEVPAHEKEYVVDTFNKWDTRGTGYISEKELTAILLALNVPKDQCKTIFQQADWNNDGKISYKEFVYWLYRGSAPKAVADKARAPTFKLKVEVLQITLSGSSKASVKWVDHFTGQVIAQSPDGPTGPPDKIALDKAAPIIFEIPSDDQRSVGVEIHTPGMLWGSSVAAVGELELGAVAKAMASGLGHVDKIEISCHKEGGRRTAKPEEIGKIIMSLSEATDADSLWARQIVQEWKKEGLPELPGFADVKGVMEVLVIEGDPTLERQVVSRFEELALGEINGWPALPEGQAADKLDGLADWMDKFKQTGRIGGVDRTQYTREQVTTQVIKDSLTGEPDYKKMKIALKFAQRVDNGNREIYGLERVFKEILKFPDNARMDDLMAAPDADLVQLQPPDLGLALETDNEHPPRCDDHTRFAVRDDTAERVLRMLGCFERLHYASGLSYERLGPEAISDPKLQIPPSVAALCKKIHLFRGDPDVNTLSLAQCRAARGRNWEALIGRFDVVAQPVIAEYDRDFQPIGPTAELPTGFFGAAEAATQIGGKGWFWVLHAAAMNIGETARAEDFKEYSIKADTKYKGRWAGQDVLDERKYIVDMTVLWRRSLEAAVALGIQDMVMFPFGMGAFLRNLHQLDGYYSEAIPRRNLRKGVARGLFISLAELINAGNAMRVHVCLVDTGLESRVNHNVFIEAAKELVDEMPALATMVKFHRNCDALELARSLASSPAGSATEVRPVGMLNGANNKLLGNHWFAQGARSAIDENLHRRCGSMCVGSLLMNMATSPQDRSLQELATNVKLLGGQVVDLKPFPVSLGPSNFPGRIFQRINVMTFGVLGIALQEDKQVRQAAPPNADTCIVDPCDMQTIRSGPSSASGISSEIYTWLGIKSDAKLPDPVTSSIKGPLQAKCHSYGGKLCIHSIGPNLREGRSVRRDKAIEELTEAYYFILYEFAQSGAKILRLCPLCSLAGQHAKEIPTFTAEAFSNAFAQLPTRLQDKVLCTEGIHLCIYSSQEVPAYAHAFRSLN